MSEKHFDLLKVGLGLLNSAVTLCKGISAEYTSFSSVQRGQQLCLVPLHLTTCISQHSYSLLYCVGFKKPQQYQSLTWGLFLNSCVCISETWQIVAWDLYKLSCQSCGSCTAFCATCQNALQNCPVHKTIQRHDWVVKQRQN